MESHNSCFVENKMSSTRTFQIWKKRQDCPLESIQSTQQLDKTASLLLLYYANFTVQFNCIIAIAAARQEMESASAKGCVAAALLFHIQCTSSVTMFACGKKKQEK